MNSPRRIWCIATEGHTWRADDLSGRGAAQEPGRWNPAGRAVVYCSSSIALACLETVVHLSGDQPLPLLRWLVAIDVPDEHWQQRMRLIQDDLPGWDSTPPDQVSRTWGERWLASEQTLLAAVPSVIVPEESNVLINPNHPACKNLVVHRLRRWTYDARLS